MVLYLNWICPWWTRNRCILYKICVSRDIESSIPLPLYPRAPLLAGLALDQYLIESLATLYESGTNYRSIPHINDNVALSHFNCTHSRAKRRPQGLKPVARNHLQSFCLQSHSCKVLCIPNLRYFGEYRRVKLSRHLRSTACGCCEPLRIAQKLKRSSMKSWRRSSDNSPSSIAQAEIDSGLQAADASPSLLFRSSYYVWVFFF